MPKFPGKCLMSAGSAKSTLSTPKRERMRSWSCWRPRASIYRHQIASYRRNSLNWEFGSSDKLSPPKTLERHQRWNLLVRTSTQCVIIHHWCMSLTYHYHVVWLEYVLRNYTNWRMCACLRVLWVYENTGIDPLTYHGGGVVVAVAGVCVFMITIE